MQDLGQNLPLGTFVPIFPGIRANVSGFVDIFSGGALRQDVTSFDYTGSVVKILGAHTLNFGAGYERNRIDANDYSYTPGDNTFNGQRTAAPTGAALPAGAKKSGSGLADFYLGPDSQFFQDNGRTVYLRGDRPYIYARTIGRSIASLRLTAACAETPGFRPPISTNAGRFSARATVRGCTGCAPRLDL